ncbi:MAG: hydantoinase/oxoprolinase family protein [Candidatus Bathycorpusculaceae bacterium]
MVNVIGLDVGGANTKIAFLKVEYGIVETVKVASEYFPVWKRDKGGLPALLKRLRAEMAGPHGLDAIGVTMTAELSDAYTTKREGVYHVLDSVESAFLNRKIFVLDVNVNLISLNEARAEPLRVASANWAATGWMVSKIFNNCIVIDVGSTSTSIIPVLEGKVAAEGKNDLEKLINGELVYTGALRTNIAAIVNLVHVRGEIARVSSELFATSGDVHLILGNIKEADYTVDTADGRGKSRAEAIARLARIVCADNEMLSENEIVKIANYVYHKQVEQIADALKQVYERVKTLKKQDFPIVITGLGRKFLAYEAAKVAGFEKINDLDELLGNEAALASPCVGVALMVASKLLGRDVVWKQL